MSPIALASVALRSGSGTWASCSLMVSSSWPWQAGLIAGRHVAPDEFGYFGLDRRALQQHAAIGPFDLAVAVLDLRLGEDDKSTLEAALLGKLLDPLACVVVKLVVDPHDE